ncbi:CHC2 zinc finger domain-containing protein [Zunongwangia sp.]|uniref:CHC2 zinc finger domain-containing protein n=1 Tax=Zunongwangia sp. TaxID=1965325 RepID=UPI003AA8D427
MNCKKAKNINLTAVLKKIGAREMKKNNHEIWYLSPFRNEQKASFKINLKKNTWYDFGFGSGGTVIDLVMRLQNCTISEALLFLSDSNYSFSFHQQKSLDKSAEKINIIKSMPIKHNALKGYLKERKIDLHVAQQFCYEVNYSFRGKTYFSIGLKNRLGGYELRNKFFKNSSSPKTISLIQNNKSNLIVCEGMFDFLSLICYKPILIKKADFLILNSLSFIAELKNYYQKYDCIELYLDRDNSGKNATKTLLEQSSKCFDMSLLYEGFTDINGWWMNYKN